MVVLCRGLAAAVPPVVAAATVNAVSSAAASAAMRRVNMVSPYGGGRVPVGSGLLMPECARVMRGHHEEQPTELPTELDVLA